VALFAALSWLAVKLLRASVNEATAPRWLVLATRQIAARPAYTVVQVSALAVGLLALVLLVLLRTDLVASWRRPRRPMRPTASSSTSCPSRPMPSRRRCARRACASYDWYPMIRGRLVAVNGRAVTPDDFTEDRAKRLVDREFNLSNAATRPRTTRWWPGAGRRRGRRGQRRGGHCQDAEPEARRQPALRHRRRAHRRPHHQPAQGGLGLDARQLSS
jgi:putative ABC transport system permease protein